MRDTFDDIGRVLRTLLARPDELMLEMGAGGELLVARIRAVASLLLLALPLIAITGDGATREVMVGLSIAVLVNLVAQCWLVLARRQRRHAWLPLATVTWDVSATTLALALLSAGDPASGLNSVVVWCCYVASIVVTALRNDGRLTLYAGALALVQYAALATIVIGRAPDMESLFSVDYGGVSVAAQLERMVLLVVVAFLTAAMVYRQQRLIEASGRDAATGLPNRAGLVLTAPRQLDAARKGGGSLTLALIDLDHFQRRVAEDGVSAGDRMVRHVAALLSELPVAHDALARIGRQEFVVLLPGPIGSVWERLERTRQALGTRPVPGGHAGEAPASFSAGLATFPHDGTDLAALLTVADRRLRQAKDDGRGRISARDA